LINYLKTVEVASYVKRVKVKTGDETVVTRIASRLIDAWLERTLSIKHHLVDFELNHSMRGRIPVRPIVGVDPVDLTTGFRIIPLRRTARNQRERVGSWLDVTIPDDVTDLYNPRTGRLELGFKLSDDYGRNYYGSKYSDSYRAEAWLAEMEIKAGHLVDTKLGAVAANGATTLTLRDTDGIVENVTYLTVGDTTTGAVAEYLVTDVTGLVATISPALVVSSTQPINTAVTQVVPEEIKLACAMTIEDRLTYEPNTFRQTETLGPISDRFSRLDKSAIPVDAQLLLAEYKN
jgi:hypothetical protein